MEIQNILQADVLDIIFEGRNKSYGAYELRRNYNRRIKTSVLMMLGSLSLLILLASWTGKRNGTKVASVGLPDVFLEKIKPDIIQPPVIPPHVEKPLVHTVIFTPPRIVKTDVPDNEKPPVNADIETAKIGNVNQLGADDAGITAPPDQGIGKGIIEKPKNDQDDPNKVFLSVEVESQYPGGVQAWQRFLNKTFSYPEEVIEKEIQGSVLVKFIVDKKGNVSNVEAVSGPEELRAEAVRVIARSGKWIPAIQNGTNVNSYKTQPVIFKINP